MNKIMVVGTAASGKTTFARNLAVQLQVDHIELDNLFWLDNWTESASIQFQEKFINRVRSMNKGFVIDGNYSLIQNLILSEIDTVIWLDYSLRVNLYRVIKRSLYRVISQRKIWKNSNNREHWAKLLSKDSIILWVVQTHGKNRLKYLQMMNATQCHHIKWLHFHKTEQLDEFLKHLSPK